MKTLVVAATIQEITAIYDHFDLPHKEFVQTKEFDLLITGVGMTATAYNLGKYLSEDYALVLNLGIAGSFDKSVALGTVLNIISDEFSELGAEDKNIFLTIDDLGFGKSHYCGNYTTNHPVLQQISTVTGITVNKVHGNTASIAEVTKRLSPFTESMEGAAVFYACEKAGIPALQIRGVSNYVEERNRDAWNIGLAIKNLNQWAIEFLTNA